MRAQLSNSCIAFLATLSLNIPSGMCVWKPCLGSVDLAESVCWSAMNTHEEVKTWHRWFEALWMPAGSSQSGLCISLLKALSAFLWGFLIRGSLKHYKLIIIIQVLVVQETSMKTAACPWTVQPSQNNDLYMCKDNPQYHLFQCDRLNMHQSPSERLKISEHLILSGKSCLDGHKN